MKKITILFFLFVSITFIGQVKGKITDLNNNPLSFVSVYFDKTVTGTTSNDNGEYILELKKKGKHTIVFQFLGYKTLKKEVDVSSFPFELDVKLEEENVELTEVLNTDVLADIDYAVTFDYGNVVEPTITG